MFRCYGCLLLHNVRPYKFAKDEAPPSNEEIDWLRRTSHALSLEQMEPEDSRAANKRFYDSGCIALLKKQRQAKPVSRTLRFDAAGKAYLY